MGQGGGRRPSKASAFQAPSTTVRIPMRGDLAAEIDELETRLRRERDIDGRENRSPVAPQVARQLLDLQEELAASEVTFRFRGLGRKAYTDLVSEWPATAEQRAQADELGVRLEWNTDEFPPRLAAASCVEPADWTVDDFVDAFEQWSTGTWTRLWRSVISVNAGVAESGPKSVLASAILAGSAQSSTTARPAGSPAASS